LIASLKRIKDPKCGKSSLRFQSSPLEAFEDSLLADRFFFFWGETHFSPLASDFDSFRMDLCVLQNVDTELEIKRFD
jgi:hypothetical protein